MNTQQRAILSKARRLLAMDAEWDESKHPRAENGQFGKGSLKDGRVNFPELSDSEIAELAKVPLAVTPDMGQGARKKAVAKWIQIHLQGKSVKTSDGKMIQFNAKDSTEHLSYDSRRNHLRALAVPHIADVFKNGEAKGRSEPNHDHKDKSIVAFHAYQKWVELENQYGILMEVQAVERDSGKFEFAAYTHKIADKKKGNRSGADDSGEAVRHVEYGLPSADNHTPTQNQMQGCELFRILKITDPKGNDVSKTYDETITDKNGRDVTETYAEGRLSLAQDRSLRSYDQDGRLHVETSNISKATVNPYYGSEIPNHQQLGLEPKKVYYLLRDPEELEKAVQTFNNLPLLSKHIPVSADEPQKDVIVGTTGSDAKFEDGYLKCSLAVWDSEAIAGIESGEQMELSSAYRYVADMTPGEFKGMRYDGVMRDIVGNHVALVDVGRAGRDVVVSDADPFSERKVMKLKKGAKARIHAVLKPLMAQDAELSPDELLEVIGSLTNEVQTAEDEDDKELPPTDEAAEEVGTDEEETAADEDEEKVAEDEEESEAPQPPEQAQDRGISKVAMDKAIAAAVSQERKRMQALATAQREVAHIVGDVAMDSAEDVYKFALEQHGVDVAGVHPSAYRAMVGLIGKSKGGIAMDSANSASKQFKGLNRIRKG